MLTFAIKKKRTPSIAPKRHAPTVSPMSHSLHLQQAKVRHILRSPTLQAKLTIGAPNDKYEQEADRVADEVMRMPDPKLQRQPENEEEEETLQTKPLADQITPLVQRQEEPPEEEEETVQAKAMPGSAPEIQRMCPQSEEETAQRQPTENEEEEEVLQRQADEEEEIQKQPEEEEELQAKSKPGEFPAVTPAVSSSIQSLQGGGQPLSRSERSFFEPRFGANFSKVRVHNNTQATSVARSVNARAFTLGHNVVFGAGEYSPNTSSGRKLLAHELTHTVQQKGNTQRKIQRGMKFEFQTGNFVWAGKKTGAPSPLLLPRKFAPTSTVYKKRKGKPGRASEERGDKPAYLSVGKHGKPARKARYGFVEVAGPPVMKKAKSGVDASKDAQFVKEYKFATQVVIKDIKDKPVAVGQLKLVSETDNATITAMEDKYNPNTFEFKYLNADGTQLDVHLNKDRVFKEGHVKLMKVGKGKRKDIDYDKEAQKIEIWKITIDAAGKVDFFGEMVKVEQVGKTVDYADRKKYPKMKGMYNPGIYEKNYYLSTDFDGETLKPTAKRWNVHISKDGSSFKRGRAKFMERKRLPEKEQTAIELQSESGGVLEFETPKYFDDWSELKLRIQDAVDITNALSDPANQLREAVPEEKAILDAIDRKKSSSALGRVFKWPADYSTSHLKKLKKDKRSLLVQIVDPTWKAQIQSSYEVSLSQYSKLLKAGSWYYYFAPASTIISSAELIFNAGFDEVKGIASKKPKFWDKGKEKVLDLTNVAKSDLANLKGFLQIITNYLINGQFTYTSGIISKDIAAVMSRTSFYSMYHSILGETERLLFQYMVKHNTITKSLEAPLNTFLASNKRPNTPGSVASTFASGNAFIYRRGHKTGSGPKIKAWLKSIIHGYKAGGKRIRTDRLSPPKKGSAAMGRHEAGAEPGDENIVRFELRYSQTLFGGQNQPASNWVTYAEKLFKWAAARGDTPDNPATPDVNEAAKTGLKE